MCVDRQLSLQFRYEKGKKIETKNKSIKHKNGAYNGIAIDVFSLCCAVFEFLNLYVRARASAIGDRMYARAHVEIVC